MLVYRLNGFYHYDHAVSLFLSEIARIDCTETIFVALNTRDLSMLKENLV